MKTSSCQTTEQKEVERTHVTKALERYLSNPNNRIKVIPFAYCTYQPIPRHYIVEGD